MRRNLVLPRIRHAKAVVEPRQRRQARAHRGGPVIALFDRDELIALGLALGMPVIADKSERAVDRVRPAKGEIDVVQIARAAFGQCCGQTDGRFGPQIEIAGRIRQATHLIGGGLDHAFVAIACVHAPQARKTVDQLAAFGVGDGGPFGRLQDAHATRLVAAKRRYGVNKVLAVQLDKGIGQHVSLRKDQPSACDTRA